MAKLQNVTLLCEPIAAALSLGLQVLDLIDEEEIWLTYDMGGGTTDVAVLKV